MGKLGAPAGMASLLVGNVLMSCSTADVPPRHIEASAETIGTATIDEKGVLTLSLIARGQNGEVGHGVVTYEPGSEHYEKVLRHVGPIRPGETKPVKAWPEDLDG